MIPAIAMALIELAPALIGLVKGEQAGKTAEKAVHIAKMVTGEDTPEKAIEVLTRDQKKLAYYQQETTQAALDLYAEETKQLREINKTIRVEVASEDPYVRRMRPTFGYLVAISWAGMMGAIVYTMIVNPRDAAIVISAFAGMSTMWGVALSVLGVYVYRRTSEKNGDIQGMKSIKSIAKGIFGAGK